MDKYEDNSLVEPLDAIILLNDNYEDKGLKEGYIGMVMDNYVKQDGVVVAEFFNPINGKDIQSAIVIKKEDFRVVSGSAADQRAVEDFRELFKSE